MSDTLQERNKATVQASFDRWRTGTGSPFELLVPESAWTIVGPSPFSRRYATRQEVMDLVIHPFNARMATPLEPTMHGVYADGEIVVSFFDANATAKDGVP